MEIQTDAMLDNSSTKYSSELASQDKMIIRIKKQEQDVDIEGKDSSTDSEETVSYTCEFVQKVDETKSEFNDLCDEPIESVRQDENFIYPAITHSDEEDTNDLTWQPGVNMVTRKHIKCLYPKVNKSQTKKKKYKSRKTDVELTVKRIKKEQVSKNKKVLEDINATKPGADSVKQNVTVTSDSIPKKTNDPPSPKVCKPRKGMATPKQRLGRILKIHKMMK